MAEREIVCWGLPDSEYLTYETRDEAIEWILDAMGERPTQIVVCGFAHMVPYYGNLNPLEHCIEYLDEEYGDPDGGSFDPTPAMLEAEKMFLAVIEREYTPWACEEVCRETVDVQAWVSAHRPDWLHTSPMDTVGRHHT